MSSAKGKGSEYIGVNHGNSYQDLELLWRKRYWGVRELVDKAHDRKLWRTWSCWEEPWTNSQQRTKTSVLQPQKSEYYQQHCEFETWLWTPERKSRPKCLDFGLKINWSERLPSPEPWPTEMVSWSGHECITLWYLVRQKYQVSQNIHSDFSATSYRKTWMNWVLANPIETQYIILLVNY